MVMQQRDAEAVPQAIFMLFVWPATPRPASTVGDIAPTRTASYSAFVILLCHFTP